MSEMPNNTHSKLQKYIDARKAQQDLLLPKKVGEDDDDEGGGGNGKRMQSSYKLEKLLGVLEKGRVKAQNFWRFLAKEGLDSHETKKTTLGVQKEETTKVSEKTEKNQEIKENQEHAKEILQESIITASETKSETSWQRAKALEGSSNSSAQRFGFQDASPFSVSSNSAAEATRKSVMGNRLAGSITSGTTNPLGFARQVDITGEASKANAKAAAKVSAMFVSKTQSSSNAAPSAESSVANKQSTNSRAR